MNSRELIDLVACRVVDLDASRSLFFSGKPEAIGWQGVSEVTRLERIRQAKADAIKARDVPCNNVISLIDAVFASLEPREGTFSNVKDATDG